MLVPAWNEWTEQAVLEPTDQYGAGYLHELRASLREHGQYSYNGAPGQWLNASAASASEEHTPEEPPLSRCALEQGPLLACHEDRNYHGQCVQHNVSCPFPFDATLADCKVPRFDDLMLAGSPRLALSPHPSLSSSLTTLTL